VNDDRTLTTPPLAIQGGKRKARLGRLIWVVLLIGLLWWALRDAPLTDIWSSLQKLQLWQLGGLLVLNAVLYVLVTLRWWFIVQADNKHVSFLPLLGVRVSVFGISYFTLGPQVGGEPLQVWYLRRNYGLTLTRATASVVMDKLLEFLVNFLLLAFGLVAVTGAGILTTGEGTVVFGLVALVTLALWPPAHIALLYSRRYPVSALLRALPFIRRDSKPIRFIRASEWLVGSFCRRHFASLLAALGVSLLAGTGMVAEYALMISFLGIHLPFWHTVAAWTAGWLAFLMPLPGGLGALEASQVFALGIFGYAASTAIGVTLLMRGRDILIGGLGLLLAGTLRNNKKVKIHRRVFRRI
jgi:uncharacterized protein (TIRG00374 family)